MLEPVDERRFWFLRHLRQFAAGAQDRFGDEIGEVEMLIVEGVASATPAFASKLGSRRSFAKMPI